MPKIQALAKRLRLRGNQSSWGTKKMRKFQRCARRNGGGREKQGGCGGKRGVVSSEIRVDGEREQRRDRKARTRM